MTIDKSVFIPVDPDTAFALITEPERLRRWQTVAARVDLRVGGDYRWTITPGHSAAGTFTEIEPGKRVVFTWGWQGPEAGSQRLHRHHHPGAGRRRHNCPAGPRGPGSGEQVAGHTEGWNHYLGRLVTLATTGDAGADDWAAAPDPINELISAEATLAIAQRTLAALNPSDMGLQTPCEDFTVAALVEHLVGSVTGIGKALGVAIADDAGASPKSRGRCRPAATWKPSTPAAWKAPSTWASPNCPPPPWPTS